jgi:protein transport protein SEC24
MNSMTQQFGQMDMSQKHPPGGAAANSRPVALNQLYPTDLLNTPFNVAELHYPPPPVILPPNVGDLELYRANETVC